MKTRITELLGIQYPIIQGGMAWVAEHHLAAAVSAAGGLGLIGGANAPGEVVREEIRKARELTDKPIGVNVMLLSPHADDVARVVVEEGIKVVTTGAGNPEKYMDMWKAAGIKVIPVVASVALAKRMEKYGADAVVAEGMESGGHIGEQTTMTLVPQVVDAVSIPVIANGDITDPLKARAVLDYTGADALMIGRAAQGRPWIFREIQHYLDTGELLPPLPLAEVKRLLCAHVRELHDFYGPAKGYRIARKHVSWYLQEHAPNDQFRRTFNAIEDASEQLEALEAYFENFA